MRNILAVVFALCASAALIDASDGPNDWRVQGGDAGMTKYAPGTIPSTVTPQLAYKKRFYSAWNAQHPSYFYGNNLAIVNGQAVLFSNDVPNTVISGVEVYDKQVTVFDWAAGQTFAKFTQPYFYDEHPREIDSHHCTNPMVWHTDGRIYSRRGGDFNLTFALDPMTGKWQSLKYEHHTDANSFMRCYGDRCVFSGGDTRTGPWFGSYDISAAAFAADTSLSSGEVGTLVATMGPFAGTSPYISGDTPKIAQNICVCAAYNSDVNGQSVILEAVDVRDGTRKWQRTYASDGGGQMGFFTSVSDYWRFLATEDGQYAFFTRSGTPTLHVLDLNTGVEKWSRVFSDANERPLLAYHGGYLYVVGRSQQFKCNVNTGAIVWQTGNSFPRDNGYLHYNWETTAYYSTVDPLYRPAVLTDDSLWFVDGDSMSPGSARLIGLRTSDGGIAQSIDLVALTGHGTESLGTVTDLVAAGGKLGILLALSDTADPNMPGLLYPYQDLYVYSFGSIANQPPVIASLSATPNPVHAAQTVSFAASVSDPNGDSLAYAWDFGDGLFGVGAVATHPYATAGTYTAKVTVTDGKGGVVSRTVLITVTAAVPGLVGYWKFDESSGTTAADSSGMGNTGFMHYDSTWTTGRVGNALTFTGGTSIVLPDTPSLNVTGDITLTAWVKTNGAGNTKSGTLIGGSSSYGVANAYAGYWLIMNYTAPGSISFWSGAAYTWVSSGSATYNDGLWHHVAVTVSGTVATFYKDGVVDGIGTTQPPNAYAGTRAIGADTHGDFGFDGSLDEVRIYNGALSAAEVAVLAGGGGGGPVAPGITLQPANQTVTVPATATFSVSASGTPAPTYQWQSAPSGSSTFTAISGANWVSYTTGATSTAMSGTQYRCVASNSAGSATSSVALLTVNAATVAPSITTQPVNQTVTAPAIATFSVAASGTPPPTYQWQSAPSGSSTFTAISSATSTSYTTGATSTAMSGTQYRCMATNSAGSATSSVATLTVNAATVAPSITTQPVNQTVTAPATATFSVAASGTPTPTYQWQLAPSGSSTFTAISGATSTSYTTGATSTAMSGNQYRCVASNSVGSVTSTAATLTVNAASVAPAITTQPVNQTVTAPATATFSVAASGSPTPTYQWQSAPSGSSTYTTINGATAASYTTGATSTAISGANYRCVATNSAGSATSTAATLTVNAASTATATFITADTTTQGSWKGVYGADGYNVIGDSSSYPSYAQVSISGEPLYTWAASSSDVRAVQKAAVADRIAACWYTPTSFDIDVDLTDGQSHQFALYMLDWDAIARSQTVEIHDAGTGALLDTRSSTAFANGLHWVWSLKGHLVIRLIYPGGSVNAVVSGLFFGGAGAAAPAITTQPVNQTVTAPATATFSVAANGSPTPTYQWQSAPSGSSTYTAISGATSASYTTSATSTSMSGNQYRCVASNSAGSATSTAATLTVNAAAVAPAITTQPVNQSVTAPATATFSVAASGSPTPTYQWQSAPSGSSTYTAISGATSASYTTGATSTAMSGTKYRCVATNSAGNATSSAATLTVNAAAVAPAITTQPVNQTVTAPATATFSVAASGSPTPTYQWESAPSGSSTFTAISGATSTSYTTGATSTAMSGTTYRCVASNSAGSATSTAATLTVNASATPTASVAVGDAVISEAGPNPGTFIITLSSAPSTAVTIAYSLTGRARNGVDYVTLPTTATIAAGQTTATVTVTPIDDTRYEKVETVILTVKSGTGYSVGSPTNATLSIQDNEGLQQTSATVSTSAAPTVGTVVTYTAPTNSEWPSDLNSTWTWGDGTPLVTVTGGVSAGHAFATAGTYAVAVTITDPASSATVSETFSVGVTRIGSGGGGGGGGGAGGGGCGSGSGLGCLLIIVMCLVVPLARQKER